MSETFFKRKSAAIVKQLSDLKNLLTPEYLNGIDEAGLLVRLELVDRLEQNFEVIQSGLEEENLNEIDSNTRALFFENFVDTKTAINRQLSERRRAIGARQSTTVRQFSLDDPQSQPSFIVTQPKSRLPVLPVPTFSGNYAEWLDFYSMFQTVFGNDNDLTKIEKFQYLKSSLKSPALDTVNSLEINEQNYDLALEMLKKRYDNKRLSFQIHIKDIFALKKVETGAVAGLRELSDKVSSHLRALNTMGTKEQLADGLLIHLVGQKMDLASQTKWEEQTPINTIPSWDSMSTFLDKRCQTLENVENAMVKETSSKQVSKKPNTNFSRKVLVASDCTNVKTCEFCDSSEHNIYNCQSFKNLSPAIRYEEVKRRSLCLNCLKKGHLVSKCRLRGCSICHFKHHTLLHLKPVVEFPPSRVQSLQPPVSSNTALISTSHSPINSRASENRSENCVFIATAIIFIRNRAGSNIPCRAILDSASQLHCITSRLANQLHLRKEKLTTIISGIGEADVVSNESTELILSSRVGGFTTSLTAIIVPTITDNQPSYSVNCVNWNIPRNIDLADPTFFKTQKIDVLIGAGLFFELLCVGQIRLREGLPLLQKTRLGWIVCGGAQQIRKQSCLVAKNILAEETLDEDSHLHDLVKSFWEVEDCTSDISKASKDDLDCENHFVQNLVRLKSGEYSVRLPFKICPSQLGDSYHQALRRFLNLEKKLQHRPELKALYSAFMKEYEELKHMSLLNSIARGVNTYFLPHHCVLKAESSTTKLRVVFDGSAVTSSGKSLNDILHAGPTIQAKLFDILLRFRTFKIALTGDICKMYRCVRVRYPDNHLQCVLWRENPLNPIKVYKLDTVTYGTKPAAFLAIRTMHQLALDEETAFPIGSRTVRRDFYVDDLISGGNSTEEVLELMKETSELLQRGNFKIRKWCSNSSMVLNNVAEKDRETFLKFHDGSDVTKTLGLTWDPNSDQFLFSFVSFLENQRITKRTVLSFIARFYDPLGLMGPVIAKAKIYIQVLWKEKMMWDESLPQSLQSIWTDYCAELKLADSFSFPRFVLVPGSNLELHAFCDASLLAYGVCIYIRSELDGLVQTSLLCSKSRVAPLKTLTIPKLELAAATILAELVQSIFKLNIFHGEFHCWSDSTTVLFWLREEPTNYNVFVANRVSKIQTLTNGMAWHYVPSLMNPADILSKGATARELINSSLWQHGPSFLRGSQQHWPICPALVQDLPEKRKRVLLTTFKFTDNTLERKYSNSFPKMQRIYAYIYRFTKIKNMPKPSGPLSINEIQQGTIILLRMVQKVHLAAEYRALEAKKSTDSNSNIKSLNPFLDNCGLLRVGGRLQNSLLDFESKHPIILPKNHPLTNSIIDNFHQKFLHAGTQSLLASIKLQYWPIGGRKTICRVINKCVRCFRAKPKLAEHIMGSLPLERVQGHRTFLVTGVDFCGPFYYQSEVRNRPPVKCYICLFICFATKAVHLELVKDLSTLSFLASLKRFICTRGKPKTIWSDNGTNFVGAKSELEDLRKLFLSENHIHDVQKQCLEDGIEWQFIPPRSPHFGGLWEASIKLAKYHFWRSVANEVLNFEELRTLVCQISAIINSRPLYPITENPEDLEVLTPAHFLVGAPFTSIVEPDVTMLNIDRLSRWQRVSFLQQAFWKKWSKEYLTNLQERNKWRSSSTSVAVGNMVLLKDENLPPLKWPLARVIEIIKGADDVARVAILRTNYGTTRRAVAKLCPLPIHNDAVEPPRSSTGGGCSE